MKLEQKIVFCSEITVRLVKILPRDDRHRAKSSHWQTHVAVLRPDRQKKTVKQQIKRCIPIYIMSDIIVDESSLVILMLWSEGVFICVDLWRWSYIETEMK